MRFRSFSRKRNINTLVTVTVTNLCRRRCLGRRCSVREFVRCRYIASDTRSWVLSCLIRPVDSRVLPCSATAGKLYSVSSLPATCVADIIISATHSGHSVLPSRQNAFCLPVFRPAVHSSVVRPLSSGVVEGYSGECRSTKYFLWERRFHK